jgi:hypothetical protein
VGDGSRLVLIKSIQREDGYARMAEEAGEGEKTLGVNAADPNVRPVVVVPVVVNRVGTIVVESP